MRKASLYFATNNENDPRVQVFIGSELELLIKSKVFDIINNVTKSDMTLVSDWIPENDDKEKCHSELSRYLEKIGNHKEREIINKVLKAFEMSLNSEDAVCFYFLDQ